MWGGDKPHSLYLPQGHIPDCALVLSGFSILLEMFVFIEDRKTAGQASTWRGMKTWEVREPRLNDFLVRGWEKGMCLVEEENIKKKEARKIARLSKSGLKFVLKLPAKGTAKPVGPSHLHVPVGFRKDVLADLHSRSVPPTPTYHQLRHREFHGIKNQPFDLKS
jgi:hypothetical protein